ncbi:hypothetical protein JCM6882_007106, partial [Rhodosporidiobolus microsporus]
PADAPKVNYRRPSFLRKFLELQAVMWRTNQGLTDRHAYDSRPHSWPLLLRGINFWVKDHRQVYLIGNPFVWALSTLSVVAYGAVRALLILRAQRGYKDFANSQVVFYDRVGTFLVAGWFLHYFPFFLMGRQLFLHHYFPALYFALLLTATTFDLVTSLLRPRLRLQLAGVLVLFAVFSWWRLSPLAYAGVWTRGQCEAAKKWGKRWDFSCGDFHEKASDYSPHPSSLIATAHTSAATASLAPAVQPGRAGFVAPEKAPASSGVPPPPEGEPHHRAQAVEDKPLFVDVRPGEDDDNLDKAVKPEEAGTTAVVADQPALAPGQDVDDDAGIAIPAAAEGTSVLPIKAVVQGEDGGGGAERMEAEEARKKQEEEVVEEKEGRRRIADAEAPEEEDEDLEVEPVEEDAEREEREVDAERELRQRAAARRKEAAADIDLSDDVDEEDE